jgi:hypothetical protein
MSAATPFTPSLPQVAPLAPGAALKLPLSRDMALRFQALLRTYELLAELVLCTVRVDVRCRTIFHLDLTMKNVRAVGVRGVGADKNVRRATSGRTARRTSRTRTSSTSTPSWGSATRRSRPPCPPASDGRWFYRFSCSC